MEPKRGALKLQQQLVSRQVPPLQLPGLQQEAARAQCEWRVPWDLEGQAELADPGGELAHLRVLLLAPYSC